MMPQPLSLSPCIADSVVASAKDRKKFQGPQDATRCVSDGMGQV